ncbi:16116_t:CDS:10 [Funneliformis geosporum]|uniref:13065_t:CDS:1 n=1 Tax=Funneliformis geosporum TaxID=1117311 RepID=A0A9W4SNL8_9GLOM|nr:13065_t:CDS:10 [Funneliformis geosporum]CAI2176776.1 16116_t:CDS:10 [Funneliformis geosporum]
MKENAKIFRCIPPSANWFSYNTASLSAEANLFAYAAATTVFLLNAETLQYVGYLSGHSDKINALDTAGTLCVSGSSDKTVRCWDMESQKQVASLTSFKSDILAVAWTTDNQLIVSGDKLGDLTIWNPNNNKFNKCYFIQSPVDCIAASPTHHRLVAFAFHNGAILIVNIDSYLNGHIIRRLNGHDLDIQSLCWEPKNDVTSEFTHLVSGSRDKTVRIWNVEEEKLTRTITMPGPSPHLTDQQKIRLFMSTVWFPGKNWLVSASYMGDVYLWDLDTFPARFQKFSIHNRPIFTMQFFPCGTKMITTSMDRQIIIWDIIERKPIIIAITNSQTISDLAISPMDPYKLSIGGGDTSVKIWKFSSPQNPYDISLYYKGLKNKISSGMFAYGTDMGAIGWFDEFQSDKNFKTFASYHNNKVYAIQWSMPDWLELPVKEKPEKDNMFVLSCGGDGQILLSDISRPNSPSLSVNNMIIEVNTDWIQFLKNKSGYLPKRSEIAVHPTGKYLAVGNVDGKLEIYELPSLKIIYHNVRHRAIINKLTWCPLDSEGNSFLLASGSDDTLITIHDLSDPEKLAPTVYIPSSSCKQTLQMHKRGVTDISWCPTDTTMILSSSFDGTAIVWNILDGSPISLFCGHQPQNRVFCTEWSLHDKDLVFTAGDDAMCFAWRPSENPYKPKKDFITESASLNEKLSHQKQDVLSTEIVEIPIVKDTVTNVEINRKPDNRSSKKIKKLKTLLPISSIPSRRKSLQYKIFELAHKLYGGEWEKAMNLWEDKEPGKENTDEFGQQKSTFGQLFFGEKYTARKAILKEVEAHNETGATFNLGGLEATPAILLDLWSSNFTSLVKRTEDSEEFSGQDWMILALSPIAGRDVWLSMMHRQAQKLVAKNDRHGAVMCLIACGEIHEAINIYRKAEMFREAIALAKLRLPEDEPTFSDLYNSWAIQLEKEEAYEQAALCHLIAKKEDSLHHVLNTLARRGDLSSLRASASLALMLEDDSTEERTRRYFEKIEEKKTSNTELSEEHKLLEDESGNKKALNPDTIDIEI